MAPLTCIFFNSSCIAFLADDSDLHLQFLQQKDTYKISIQIKKFFLHNDCHFYLTVHFQNWSVQMSVKIIWSLVKKIKAMQLLRKALFQDAKTDSAN